MDLAFPKETARKIVDRLEAASLARAFAVAS
jgi:hypothetical protein